MVNLFWEVFGYWVRFNKIVDDIGKIYGVIYIIMLIKILKIMLFMYIYIKNNLLKICFVIYWKNFKSENYMYLYVNLGDK